MPDQNLATQPPRKDVRTLIEGYRDQFRMALPKLVTPERFIRVALTCINKNPKLLQCTRESLLACLLDCAQLGIEPDGRRAHLIPYGDKCTLILDYKGIAELVRRSGEISTLHCGIVYPGDDFDYAFGTGQFLKHRPSLERGESKPTCVYSYVRLKDGQEDFDVMGISEVQKVRSRSRAANSGPWVTDFDEMAKKTVFRRHSKWLPLSPELRDKIEKDDDPLTEQERFAAAKTVSGGITFGPAGVDAEQMPQIAGNAEPETQTEGVHATAGDMQQGEEKPKRRRRTKSEMEAARLSEKTADESERQHAGGQAEEGAAGATRSQPAPRRATPLEGLRNLINAAPITEEELVKHLISKMAMEPHQKLIHLSEEKILAITQEFMVIAGEILDGKKEEKGPFGE